jgi:hypothetical protein
MSARISMRRRCLLVGMACSSRRGESPCPSVPGLGTPMGDHQELSPAVAGRLQRESPVLRPARRQGWWLNSRRAAGGHDADCSGRGSGRERRPLRPLVQLARLSPRGWGGPAISNDRKINHMSHSNTVFGDLIDCVDSTMHDSICIPRSSALYVGIGRTVPLGIWCRYL